MRVSELSPSNPGAETVAREPGHFAAEHHAPPSREGKLSPLPRPSIGATPLFRGASFLEAIPSAAAAERREEGRGGSAIGGGRCSADEARDEEREGDRWARVSEGAPTKLVAGR